MASIGQVATDGKSGKTVTLRVGVTRDASTKVSIDKCMIHDFAVVQPACLLLLAMTHTLAATKRV
jgi:hypothetical protein